MKSNEKHVRRWMQRLFVFTSLMVITSLPCYGAKSYLLSASHSDSNFENVSVEYEVGGTLTIPGEKKSVTVPVQVNSELVFQHRLLKIEHLKPRVDQSAAARGELVQIRGVRNYDRVKTNLKINEQPISLELRPTRQLIAATVSNGDLTLFSPNGTLTRDELDLLSIPGDRLVIDLMLPEESVKVGSRWSHDDKTIAMLLGLDAVSNNNTSSELKDVTSRYATIESNGSVTGAIEGVEANIELKARCYFDRRSRRIASFQLVTREKRGIGHVTPGIEAVAKLKIRITPRTHSIRLDDSELEASQLKPTTALMLCRFTPQHQDFRFQHDRRWHVTEDDKNTTVMRMMDRGDLLAQCNITSAPATPSRAKDLSQYKDEVKKSLGEKFERLVSARQSQGANGRTIYRVEVAGTVSELRIRWRYYLITDANDRRAVIAFTLEEDLIERFGNADEVLVDTLELSESRPDGKPKSKSPTPIAN